MILQNELSIEYGVRPALGVFASLPLRMVRETIKYETLDGDPYDPPDDGIHHRNQTLLGPGDPIIGARSAYAFEKAHLLGTVGASLPVGRTEPNPFRAGVEGRRHEHVQFGAGIFQPVLGARLVVPLNEATRLSLGAQGTLALYENRHGLRPSTRASGSLVLSRVVGSQGFSFDASLEASQEWSEHWKEYQPETEGNLGRTDLLLGGRVSWRVAKGVDVSAGGAATVFTKAVGSQTQFPGVLSLGLSWSPAWSGESGK